MDVGVPVEVEGLYGEFYPGLVTGLTSLEEYQVQLLDLSNNSHVIEVSLPPSAMRLPPELASFPFDPMQGQEVDVLIPCANSSEPAGDADNSALVSRLSAWWPGRVKKVGGGFVIVELVSTFTSDSVPSKNITTQVDVANGRIKIPLPSSIEKTDIVEKHQLRPRSHQSNFTTASFRMHTIDIPDSLAAYCREPANYQHFARRCGLPVLVCMAPEALQPGKPVKGEENETYEMKARLLVISTDITTVNRAAVIDNTFIDMLRQKVQILQQTEELSRKLEASRVSQVAAPFVEEVFVPDHLIASAIGFQGSNIRRASNIEGVLSIKLNRATGVFQISGKTKEAVLQAKALLDYTSEMLPVPRSYVGHIVGSGQRHIQHIVDCVSLSGLKICNMPEKEMADFVAFHLTGTSQAIRDARMFLEFHIASLQDLDRLRGVKNPPTLPPQKEPESENHLPTNDAEGSGDVASHPDARRKAGRSSQRNRRKQSQSTYQEELSNGDSGHHTAESHDTENSGELVSGDQTEEPDYRISKSRQRRPPSKNNNAVTKPELAFSAAPDPNLPKANRVNSDNRGQRLTNGTGHKDSSGKQNQRGNLHQSDALVTAPVSAVI